MAEADHGAEVQLKKLHPFFSASNAISKTDDAVTPPTPDSSYCSPASDESTNDPVEHNDHGEHSERKRKRRKTEQPAHTVGALPGAPRTKRRARLSAGPSIVKHFSQATASDKQLDVAQSQNEIRTRESADGGAGLPLAAPKLNVKDNHDPMEKTENRNTSQLTYDQRSQKVLRLNPTTGTLGSPPPSESATSAPTSVSGKKRGRKPKAMIVTVSYGMDVISRERVGEKINQVLSGVSRVSPRVSTDLPPKTPPHSHETANAEVTGGSIPKEHIPQGTKTTNKPAHPFFQAKGKAASSTDDDRPKTKRDKKPPKRQVIFTSTPCSPKRARPASLSSSIPASVSKGGVKVPGAQHPAWPWREVVHVRDNSPLHFIDNAEHEAIPASPKERKAKGQTVHVGERESILRGSAARLKIQQLMKDLKSMHDEDFHPITPLLRVPVKHFESGRRLQTRVFKELRTLRNNSALLKTHPAIAHAYDSIATTLSAFDMSTCESIAWAQKYAPTSARCVLQNGREAELLRDWLETLKVQAVDTGALDNALKPKSTSAPKKKRRHKKLEGFVVSSDEEANEMDEISGDGSGSFIHSGAKKTVVRSSDTVDRGGKASARLANAVLLSGPHGCGKTATVYAIAKELDFEVFEINAGARRSGKDILERVGDMTRNHLVNHQQKDEYRPDVVTDDRIAKDPKSGKQGMMTSFFQRKPSQPTKEVQKVDQPPEVPVPVSQEKKPNRDQKQSLILLEEVDILYEEDKQFWATVIAMIAQSKRPFIMTCNDESVVPLQNLKLHGIFRLSSPPTDLAVDMLLLIAANEGHALQRHAVETLYQSRDHDLRAAITELNYWCQIGVGDLRGGFDWFYPRWPKGSDVDQEGQTIRVVSQDTYHTGMGWLNRDLTTTESSSPPIVPDLHREVWDHWGLDVSDHHECRDSLRWIRETDGQEHSRATRLALLRSVETFTDVMSDSDICGPFLSSLSSHVTLDPTMPDLHPKTLDDFTAGKKVLEATPLCHYDSISIGVSTSLRTLAQLKLINSQPPHESLSSIQHFDEKRVTDEIEHHFMSSLRSEGLITRKDYSIAFDPIAMSEKILANGYLDPSVFDREMTPLCLDVAPYVRSIVSFDQRLHKERRTRSNLLSEGGEPEKKRMRTTRAALSALEGGSRATIRRERYFAADINPYLVMRTGGKSWDDLVHQVNASEEHANTTQEICDADINGT